MNEQTTPIKVNILDKEYFINCSEGEGEQLHMAVDMLNKKILEIKRSGNVVGTERIAVMAALNMVHELLAYKQKNKIYASSIDSMLKRVHGKINSALARKMELDI